MAKAKRKSKRTINSRKKGAKFERRIAREASEWCGFELRRTPASGGLLKTGDISPKRPEDFPDWPFCFELKDRKGWTLNSFFGENSSTIASWWEQCVRDSRISKKIPVLIFTKNYDATYCMMRDTLFRRLGIGQVADVVLTAKGFRVFLWDALTEIPFETVLEKVRAKAS